jgi:hypothetical protein
MVCCLVTVLVCTAAFLCCFSPRFFWQCSGGNRDPGCVCGVTFASSVWLCRLLHLSNNVLIHDSSFSAGIPVWLNVGDCVCFT